MLIETTITLEDALEVETTYVLKGHCYPAEPDVGIEGSYCDEFWFLLNGKEVELELTETQADACYERLLSAYDAFISTPLED